MKGTIKFIDLFAGIGGIRCGLELAAHEAGYKTECVFTSEIKKHAIKVLKQNHPNELINGDITQVNEKEIPDFDICCAGFPCQSFSGGGKRLGFTETRGTLFFDVERILKKKEPAGFILENVEGLVSFILTNLATKDDDVRRFFHLLNFRLLRFLPGLKLRFEIVPFLLSDAFRTFHLPGYFRRASVLDGIKIVEAFLRLPVKPHAPIKRAFTLPEKIRPVKTSLHVAAVLLSGVVRFRA